MNVSTPAKAAAWQDLLALAAPVKKQRPMCLWLAFCLVRVCVCVCVCVCVVFFFFCVCVCVFARGEVRVMVFSTNPPVFGEGGTAPDLV